MAARLHKEETGKVLEDLLGVTVFGDPNRLRRQRERHTQRRSETDNGWQGDQERGRVGGFRN